jgi:hypothetical protein
MVQEVSFGMEERGAGEEQRGIRKEEGMSEGWRHSEGPTVNKAE